MSLKRVWCHREGRVVTEQGARQGERGDEDIAGNTHQNTWYTVQDTGQDTLYMDLARRAFHSTTITSAALAAAAS